MKAHLAQIYNYTCDRNPNHWFSIEDIQPEVGQTIYCPHCGHANVVEGVVEHTSETTLAASSYVSDQDRAEMQSGIEALRDLGVLGLIEESDRLAETDKSNEEGVTVFDEQGIPSFVSCIPGKTSDGYHTFDELYEHRCILFAALMKAHPSRSWRSKAHDDGAGFDGWFIAGMSLPIALPDVGNPITYHLPNEMWDLLEGIPTLDCAPKWDGHTSQDVVNRLRNFVEGNVILATSRQDVSSESKESDRPQS